MKSLRDRYSQETILLKAAGKDGFLSYSDSTIKNLDTITLHNVEDMYTQLIGKKWKFISLDESKKVEGKRVNSLFSAYDVYGYRNNLKNNRLPRYPFLGVGITRY
jgi:hypothetical protein